MNAQRAKPALADNELLITRTFDAPVAAVFEIWTTREHMIRWWGPRDFTCTAVELNFRVGGKWRACIEATQSGVSWMGGTFREIVKDRRIVTTFAWEDGRDQPGMETLITVTFSEQNGKTTQSFHQAPFLHVEARDSHIGGWNQVFDKELVYAERMAKGGAA